jgi:hypothetical protein
VSAKLKAANQVKDHLESIRGGEYSNFLRLLLNPLCSVLKTVAPEHADGDTYRLRHTILHTLHRFTFNDVLKPYAPTILEVCLSTLRTDNEENAIEAVHMLFDLHKNYRPELGAQASLVMDYVIEMYTAFPANVEATFGPDANPSPDSVRPECLAANRSFRVVVEAPLIVIFLSQIYKEELATQLQRLVPLMIEAATQKATVKRRADAAVDKILGDMKLAQVKTIQFLTSVMKDFGPTIVAQKDVICDAIAGLLCTAPSTHSVRKELLVTVRHMMQSRNLQHGFFPHLAVFMKEENLIGRSRTATGHLRGLAYAILAELVHHMRETLTSEQLAQVVHLFCCLLHDPSLPPNIETTSVRLLLNLVQTIYHRRTNASPEDLEAGRQLLLKILRCYATKLPAMARTAQSHLQDVKQERDRRGKDRDRLFGKLDPTSEKEMVMKENEKDKDAPKEKEDDAEEEEEEVVTTRRSKSRKVKTKKEREAEAAAEKEKEKELEKEKETKQTRDTQDPDHVMLHMLPKTEKLRELGDRKHLLYTLLNCMKTLLFGITHYDRTPNATGTDGATGTSGSTAASDNPRGMTPEVLRLVAQMLLSGMEACALYWETESRPDPQGVYYLMADMLSVLDRQELQACLLPHMHRFIELLSESDHFLHIVVHLLMSDNSNQTAQTFADMLVSFLIFERLTDVEHLEKRSGALVFRLFQMIFGALTKHPNHIRGAIQPRLCTLVERCLRHVVRSSRPAGYVQVLRACFRALQSKRGVAAVQPMFLAFQPVLASTVNTLLYLLHGPSRRLATNGVVELCLTLPVNLSDQLVHLKGLVRPLMLALEAEEDHLVSLGLKTLEYWIDNLNPEFLELTMDHHQSRILASLWRHLRPGQLGFSAKALQILGKFGGRNRRFPPQSPPESMDFKKFPDHGMRIILAFEPNMPFMLPLDKSVAAARGCVRNDAVTVRPVPDASLRAPGVPGQKRIQRPPLETRVHAARFLRSCVARIVSLRPVEDSSLDVEGGASKVKEALLGEHGAPTVPVIMTEPRDGRPSHPYAKSPIQLEAELEVFGAALGGIFEAAADDALVAATLRAIPGVGRLGGKAQELAMAKDSKRNARVIASHGSVPEGEKGEGGDAGPVVDASGNVVMAGDEAVSPKTTPTPTDDATATVSPKKALVEESGAEWREELPGVDLRDFCRGLVRHLAMLITAGAGSVRLPSLHSDRGGQDSDSDNTGISPMREGMSDAQARLLRFLSPLVLVDVMMEQVVGSTAQRTWALEMITLFVKTTLTVTEEQERLGKSITLLDSENTNAFEQAAAKVACPEGLVHLASRSTHLCFSDEPAAYMSGVDVLALLGRILPRKFVDVMLVPAVTGLSRVVERLTLNATLTEADDVMEVMRRLIETSAGVPLTVAPMLNERDAVPSDLMWHEDTYPAKADASGTTTEDKKKSDNKGKRENKSKGKELEKEKEEEATSTTPPASEWPTLPGKWTMPPPVEAELVRQLVSAAFPAAMSTALHMDISSHFAGKLLVSLATAHKKTVEDLLTISDALHYTSTSVPSTTTPDASSSRASSPPHVMERVLATAALIKPAGIAGATNATFESGAHGMAQAGAWFAVGFALEQSPPLLEDAPKGAESGHIKAIIQAGTEALRVLETPLEHLVGSSGSDLVDPVRLISRLRQAALRMLGVMIALPKHARTIPLDKWLDSTCADASSGATSTSTTRTRILSAMCMALSSEFPLEVATAVQGLQAFAAKTTPTAKEAVWKESVTPMLAMVKKPELLSLHLLRGMAHVMEIAGDAVDAASLAAQLHGELLRWLDPDAMMRMEKRGWRGGQEGQIVASLLHLFQMLPVSVSEDYIETRPVRTTETNGSSDHTESTSARRLGMVVLTIQLEAALLGAPGRVAPGVHGPGPLRLPLTRLLVQHGSKTIEYFLDATRYSASSYFVFFHEMLESEAGAPLLALLAEDPMRVLLASGMAQGTDIAQVDGRKQAIQGLQLISLIARRHPGRTVEEKSVLDALSARWEALEPHTFSNSPQLLGLEGQEMRLWTDVWMAHMKETRDPRALAGMISCLTRRAEADFEVLRHFLSKELPQLISPKELTSLVTYITEEMIPEAMVPESKEVALQDDDTKMAEDSDAASEHGDICARVSLMLRLVITPCFEAAADKGVLRECLEDPVGSRLVNVLIGRWMEDNKGGSDDAGASSTVSPALELSSDVVQEIMALLTVLMRRAPDLLHVQGVRDYRRGLIRLPWSYLKDDTSPVRFSAYVMVCQFMSTMTCPEKIYLQVYTAMIKAWQPEGRQQIHEALDLILPLLPSKLHDPGAKVPMWIRWTKRSLIEDGHSLGNLVHILQFIVRHRTLFQPWHGELALLLVQSLQRIGIPPNSPVENRKLAIDIIAVIIDWEIAGRQEAATKATTDSAARVTTADEGETAVNLGTKRSHPGDAEDGDEPAARRQKTETGSVDVPATDIAADGTKDKEVNAASAPAKAPGAITIQQATFLVNFCQRIAFMLTPMTLPDSGGKIPPVDKDLLAAHAFTLRQLTRALELWPEVPVRTFGSVLKRFLDNDLRGRLDPPITLLTGLEILQRVLTVQGPGALVALFDDASQLIKHAINSTNERVPSLVIAIVEQALKGLPANTEAHPKEVRDLLTVLRREIDAAFKATADHFQRYLNALAGRLSDRQAGATQREEASLQQQISSGLATAIRASCGAIRILESLADVNMAFVDQFLTRMLMLANQIAREHIRPFVEPNHPPMRLLYVDIKDLGRCMVPDFGTAPWLVAHCLRLARGRVLAPSHADRKKAFVHTMVLLITDNNRSAQHVHTSLLLELVDAVEHWVTHRDGVEGGVLSVKEVIGSLQRLASLERHHSIPEEAKGVWEAKFLSLLYAVCTLPDSYGPDAAELRRDAFTKVERVFLCGLKARDPVLRAKFFQLYDRVIPRTAFDRLRFTMETQDWEYVAHTFWLRHALQLHLELVHNEALLYLAPNSGCVPTLLPATPPLTFTQPRPRPKPEGAKEGVDADMEKDKDKDKEATNPADAVAPSNEKKEGEGGEGAGGSTPEDPTVTTVTAEARPLVPPSGPKMEDVSDELRSVCDEHAAWLNRHHCTVASDLVTPLSLLATDDVALASALWIQVFPIVWTTLGKKQQFSLAKPMIALLSKEYHIKQADARPNVIHALLEGISISMPQPKIPPELFRFLGRTFNLWHTCLALLKSHILLYVDENRCFGSFTDLCKGLGEHDWIAGLWKHRSRAPETHAALSLRQLGLHEKAEATLWSAVDAYSQGQMKNLSVSKGELSLWVEHWLDCCRHLNFWESMVEYGRASDHQQVLMEVLWKLGSWDQLREHVFPKLCADDTPEPLIVEVQMHLLSTGDLQRADAKMTQGLHTALRRWWQLPEHTLDARIGLLQQFQRLVELMESKEVLQQLRIMQHEEVSQETVQELLDLFSTWRLRTPNEWESLAHWADVATWRNHMYSLIINTQYASEANRDVMCQAGYNNKAWSVNRLAAVARGHGAIASCTDIINNLYGYPTMQVQKAFVKIQEQALAQMADPTLLPFAWNLLNDANLSYFAPHQQAELLRLRALCLDRMGNRPAAAEGFAAAAALSDAVPEIWHSWGAFIESYAASEAKQAATLASGSAKPAEVPEESLAEAIGCYLLGIARGSASARAMFPRIIRLLQFRKPDSPLFAVVLHHLPEIPAWTALAWTPQILSALQYTEGVVAKQMLKRLVMTFPQSLYLHLRAFLLWLNAFVLKRKDRPEATDDLARLKSAFEEGRKLMQWLRSDRSQVQLSEVVVQTLSQSLSPRPHERLQSVVHAMCQRCYRVRAREEDPIPENLKSEVDSVIQASFRPDLAVGSLLKRLQVPFEQDLSPSSPTAAKTLGELIKRLKAWRGLLQNIAEIMSPPTLPLETEIPALVDLCVTGIEIPGQFQKGHDPSVKGTVFIERFGSDISVVRRQGATSKRVIMWGTDGVKYQFLLQNFPQRDAVASDDRTLQLLRLLNTQLESLPQARLRALAYTTPATAPVHSNVRLVEDDSALVMFGEALTLHLERRAQDHDAPILQFKRLVLSDAGEMVQLDPPKRMLMAYQAMVHSQYPATYVSDNIFSGYAAKTHADQSRLFAFKKRMCAQMGLYATVCFAMSLGGRSPFKILISRSTGNIEMPEFYLSYDPTTSLASNQDTVPFRLTRNLEQFFTAFAVDGILTTAITLAAIAAVQPQSNVVDFLHLQFRDDLAAWQVDSVLRAERNAVRMSSEKASGSSLPPALALSDLQWHVEGNVAQATGRFRRIAPEEVMVQLEGLQGLAPGTAEYTYLDHDPTNLPRDVMGPAKELVAAATDAGNLSRMDPTYQPWY